MADPGPTRPSLLLRIRDANDEAAWREFVDLYAPLVYGYARRRGLQDADAADLTQEVLRAVASSIGRLDYDPDRGSFRAWLHTVTRTRLHNLVARRDRPGLGSGDPDARDLLEELPAPDPAESAAWDLDYRRRLFAWAAGRVRGEVAELTWRAFWSTAVDGRPPAEVAAELGMTPGAVYVARSRVLARLRRCLDELPGEPAGDP